MHQIYTLAHADAQKILATILAEVEREGKGAAIAVADAHGELLAFLRTDGCPLPSINIAMNKAFTAARQGQESRELGESSRTDGWAMTYFGELRYTGWGGGVPVKYQGVVIGGVGVSGLPEEEDMVLARLGAGVLGG